MKTLLQMLCLLIDIRVFIAVIIEIGKTSRTFCEVAGRAEPLPADVIMALGDLGIQVNGLEEYVFRSSRCHVPSPTQATPSKQLSMLSAGSKQHFPSYMPNHLPQFPDPHAYTRTPVSYIEYSNCYDFFLMVSESFNSFCSN